MTFLTSSYCLSAQCISNSVYPSWAIGPVCIGNINEKPELLSDVGLMMVQMTIFLTFEKCHGVVCCFLLHCFCDMWWDPRQMTRPAQDFVWCLPLDISEESCFVS